MMHVLYNQGWELIIGILRYAYLMLTLCSSYAQIILFTKYLVFFSFLFLGLLCTVELS